MRLLPELALALGVVLGFLVHMAIFYGAVAMCNRCTGGESPPLAVRRPSLAQAALIIFVTGLFATGLELFSSSVIGGILSTSSNAAATAAAISDYALSIQLFLGVVCLPVLAGMTSLVLSTTFERGLLVALCHLIAAFGVGLVVVGILVLGSALL